MAGNTYIYQSTNKYMYMCVRTVYTNIGPKIV